MRQRTTFHGASLTAGASSELLVYGAASATAYPVARKMLDDAREQFREQSLPIIRTGRHHYPGQAWWELDPSLAAQYGSAWKACKRVRADAYRMIRAAAVADTERWAEAEASGIVLPMWFAAPSPRVAHLLSRCIGYAEDAA